MRRSSREAVLIQIARSGLIISERGEIAPLRAEFDAVHCVRLPQLLEPPLLAFLECRLEQGQWQARTHPGVGQEYGLEDPPALNVLHFVLNLPDFRNLIQEITGCGPLRRFRGRIYRMTAAAGHYDDWHDDNFDKRLVGISLNLSPRAFCGGLFQLRERESQHILAEIANTGRGSALIFRIADELQHRISDMEGDEPKTAFAGWFRPERPEFFAELRANALKVAGSARP
jgi:hypothetical protein